MRAKKVLHCRLHCTWRCNAKTKLKQNTHTFVCFNSDIHLHLHRLLHVNSYWQRYLRTAIKMSRYVGAYDEQTMSFFCSGACVDFRTHIQHILYVHIIHVYLYLLLLHSPDNEFQNCAAVIAFWGSVCQAPLRRLLFICLKIAAGI